MKGDTTLIIEQIFVVILSTALIFVALRQVAVPSMEAYGDVEARTIARSMATAINALGTVEEGSVSRSFINPWDIIVSCDNGCSIRTMHGRFDSGDVMLLVEAEPARISDAHQISLSKGLGDHAVRVSG
jgi:hypothetical protein